MAASLDIPLSITDFGKVMKQFSDLQNQIIKTGQVASQNLSLTAGGGSGGGIRPVTAGGGGGSVGGVRFYQGPRQRLPGLNAQMQSALKAGNDAAAGDIADAIKRAEQQIRRTQPKTFAQKFSTFARSTRFGAGGIEPLIGRTADLFGDGAAGEAAVAAGGLAIGLVKAAAALKDFILNTNQAAQNFSLLRYGTGSSIQQTAKLTAIGNALGIGPDAVAADAGNLVGAAQGGYSSIFTARAGLQTGPSNIYNLDRGAALLKSINYIRNAKTDAQAQQYAQIVGNTDLLGIRQNPAQYQQVLAAANGLAGANNAGYLQQQQGLTTALGNLKTSVDTLTAKIASFFIGPASNLVSKASGVINDANTGFDPASKYGQFLANAKKEGYGRAFLDAIGPKNAFTGPDAGHSQSEQHPVVKAMNRLADSTDRNSRATERNTQATIPGMYGNATRGSFEGDGMGGTALSRANRAKYSYQLSPI